MRLAAGSFKHKARLYQIEAGLGEAAAPSYGRLKAPDEALQWLRCENEILREERDIKKVIGMSDRI